MAIAPVGPQNIQGPAPSPRLPDVCSPPPGPAPAPAPSPPAPVDICDVPWGTHAHEDAPKSDSSSSLIGGLSVNFGNPTIPIPQ